MIHCHYGKNKLNHFLGLKMAKQTEYEYQKIQFVRLHDVDQSIQTVPIDWNEGNLDDIVLMQHQIQQSIKITIHDHQCQ